MSWFGLGRSGASPDRDRLEAVLAHTHDAQEKAKTAAGGVVQAADRQQREIEAERARIRQRTAEQSLKARERQSEQRSLVEEFLLRTGQVDSRDLQ